MANKVEVFTSPTCPHCPGAVMVVEEAKKQLGDQIEVSIEDTSENESIEKAMKYEIQAVPTIVIDGKVQFVGAPTIQELLEKLEELK